MNKYMERTISSLTTITIPVIISSVAILFLLSPIFMELEYRRPNFPEAEYGFSTAERLLYGHETRSYLITDKSLNDLRDLRFHNGDPIYIERELKHLEDVKVVLQGLFKVFFGAKVILIASGIIAFRSTQWGGYKKAISRGGWLTTGLLGGILVLSIVSFQETFTNFHYIFFEGNSWLFRYSDTLIRLFPVQFWKDIFLVFGVLSLACGVMLGLLLRGTNKPPN